VASGGAAALNCNSAANATVRRVLSRLNPAGAGPIVVGLGTYFGPNMQWNAGGNQRYNGLLFSLERRVSQGVSLGANWTWSHCLGQLLGYNTKADQTITDPNNIKEVGNCDADHRHLVNIATVGETPRFLESHCEPGGIRLEVIRHLQIHFRNPSDDLGRATQPGGPE
jgi:hypothetical protein